MELLVQTLIPVAFGVITASIANSRGRSPALWFFAGLFLQCIALILVLVLPDLKKEEAEKRRMRKENRRLRERISKERQVADERHATTLRRLGAHDAVLGVDTSEDVPPQVETRAQVNTKREWHYSPTGSTDSRGPVTLETLAELWQAGAIDAETLVWRKGQADWMEIQEHDELAREFDLG